MKIGIPMSGMSRKFSAAGYILPKYPIAINGKKVIEHIVELCPKDSDLIFIINDKHQKETDIVDVLDKLVEKKTTVTIPRHKKGHGCNNKFLNMISSSLLKNWEFIY